MSQYAHIISDSASDQRANIIHYCKAAIGAMEQKATYPMDVKAVRRYLEAATLAAESLGEELGTTSFFSNT